MFSISEESGAFQGSNHGEAVFFPVVRGPNMTSQGNWPMLHEPPTLRGGRPHRFQSWR